MRQSFVVVIHGGVTVVLAKVFGSSDVPHSVGYRRELLKVRVLLEGACCGLLLDELGLGVFLVERGD